MHRRDSLHYKNFENIFSFTESFFFFLRQAFYCLSDLFPSSEKLQENRIITNYVLPDVIGTKQEVGCFESRNCATFGNCPPGTSDLRYNTKHMADSRTAPRLHFNSNHKPSHQSNQRLQVVSTQGENIPASEETEAWTCGSVGREPSWLA